MFTKLKTAFFIGQLVFIIFGLAFKFALWLNKKKIEKRNAAFEVYDVEALLDHDLESL